MAKYHKGKFAIKNMAKYMGNSTPTYRSGWEHAFMRFCDEHPSVIKWASECVKIPYRHPFTGKQRNYIPDFLVQYKTKHDKIVTELVEIKPKKQSIMESKASQGTKEAVVLNHAKWQSAQAWCQQQKIIFRVITEDDIFRK
jgi:hypothetical protein